MILGVMSDTHGNGPLMYVIADKMITRHGVECIVHLGDNYTDAEELEMTGHRVLKVPGLWCDAYRNPRVPRRMETAFGGIKIIAAHDWKDIPKTKRRHALILTGHTHQATIQKANSHYHLNPGHLKRPVDRGERASYGIINIQDDVVKIQIFEINGKLRTEVEWKIP